jgi:glycerol-3-phosphate acyltransferase PlsY
MTASVLGVAAAYLLGSIPFGLLLVRWCSGTDLRAVGSGNIGATNALRSAGPTIGVLTLVLDLLKGILGVLFGAWIAGVPEPWQASSLASWVVLAPVAGHIFPPWLRFRGGKGVATAFGVLSVADPRVALAALAAFVLFAVPTRLVSLGSLAAAVAAAVAAVWFHGVTPVSLGIVAVAILIVVRHRENIERLRRGAETRLGSKRTSR